MSKLSNYTNQVPQRGTSRTTYTLDPKIQSALDEFLVYLGNAGLTEGSVRCYRTYVAKPIALDTPWESMTPNERTAANRFVPWLQEFHPELLEDDED